MATFFHLSDLHAGVSTQDWRWPDLKHLLFEDIKRLEDRNGAASFVLFTGDLTQKAASDEFEKITDIFEEIRSNCSDTKLKFVVLPGNHDLTRPAKGSLVSSALKAIPSDTDLLDRVFDAQTDPLDEINRLFLNYSRWFEKEVKSGLIWAPNATGKICGDAAYRLQFDDMAVGIVTLNSTWQQLSAGNFEGKLFIDPRQIQSVTDSDTQTWCHENDFSVLATHHPYEWLHPKGKEAFDSQINPSGRFDAHLYGHMHDNEAVAKSFGGSPSKRQLQASSVFGLEWFNGEIQRQHGFSMAKFIKDEDVKSIVIWPRTLQKLGNGSEKLVPDQSQDLDEDNSFTWQIASPTGPDLAVQTPPEIDPSSPIDSAGSLSKIRYHLTTNDAHKAIRYAERNDTIQALRDTGIVWHATEWGYGEDAFLAICLQALKIPEQNVFRFDLDDFTDRENFLSSVKSNTGSSFELLCELISRKSKTALILDNVTAIAEGVGGKFPIEKNVEGLAEIVRTYAPDCLIVIRGKPDELEVNHPLVSLRALDEPDTVDYLRAHHGGGTHLLSPEVVSRIWRFTGGSPPRLDTLLRDLEVTSLDELISSEEDQILQIADARTPSAMVGAIEELRTSDETFYKRCFELLEALCILPRGEQLSRLKRFFGPHPIFAKHALELSSRRLVETTTISQIQVSKGASTAKLIMLPKAVRDHVRQITPPERHKRLLSLALELYFDDEWRSGEIKSSMAARASRDPLAEPHQIINATSLLQDEIRRELGNEDETRLIQLIAAATALVVALIDGDHFRFASQFCEQLMNEIPANKLEKQLDIIRLSRARSIRMIGGQPEAIELLLAIDPNNLSAYQRRQRDLNLALAFESQGNTDEAERYAKLVLKKRGDGPAIQAEHLLAGQISDAKSRLQKLRSLEKRARNKKASVAANNLSLAIAEETNDPSERVSQLERTMESGRADKDFYNSTRAVIKLMDQASEDDEPSPAMVTRLADAYQHLYNERSERLFDRCHKALWNLFGRSQQAENLFRLFRYSSFVWRLRNDEEKETEYLETLSALLSVMRGEQKRSVSRELSYYRGRTARLPNADGPEQRKLKGSE